MTIRLSTTWKARSVGIMMLRERRSGSHDPAHRPIAPASFGQLNNQRPEPRRQKAEPAVVGPGRTSSAVRFFLPDVSETSMSKSTDADASYPEIQGDTEVKVHTSVSVDTCLPHFSLRLLPTEYILLLLSHGEPPGKLLESKRGSRCYLRLTRTPLPDSPPILQFLQVRRASSHFYGPEMRLKCYRRAWRFIPSFVLQPRKKTAALDSDRTGIWRCSPDTHCCARSGVGHLLRRAR